MRIPTICGAVHPARPKVGDSSNSPIKRVRPLVGGMSGRSSRMGPPFRVVTVGAILPSDNIDLLWTGGGLSEAEAPLRWIDGPAVQPLDASAGVGSPVVALRFDSA